MAEKKNRLCVIKVYNTTEKSKQMNNQVNDGKISLDLMHINQHLWRQLFITVFNSEECFCLFIEPHNAEFSTEV